MPNQTPGTSHGDNSGGATTYGVGITNLHVIITDDDGSWFAQALEIDYAVEGDSVEDVKDKFQSGLCDTIHAHLKTHGTVDHLINPAPGSIWQALAKCQKYAHEHSQVSIHDLVPIFKSIEFVLAKAA